MNWTNLFEVVNKSLDNISKVGFKETFMLPIRCEFVFFLFLLWICLILTVIVRHLGM